MPKTPILLATNNPDKQAELTRILHGLPFAPLTPAQAAIPAPPGDESGDTHEAIARQKAARWSAAAAGILAIATDGGLHIPALGPRWESRRTRRFAGPDADNRQRLAALLRLMQPYHGENRRAHWIEALALAQNGGILASWQITGATGCLASQPPPEISDETQPLPEFWVFALWRIPQFNAPYADLTPQQRQAAGDHWRRLARLARRYLTSTYIPPQARSALRRRD